MRCPLCHGSVTIIVNATLRIPAEFEGRLTKRKIAYSRSKLLGVDWGRSVYCCDSSQCGWTERRGFKDDI